MGMRFVVVATMRRGAVDPPEPLDDANQWLAIRRTDVDGEIECNAWQRYATLGYQLERDPVPDYAEIARLTRRNVNAHSVCTAVGRA